MFAKIKELDQRIIDFLTMICWWTEVIFDKDNLFFSLHARILYTLCMIYVCFFLYLDSSNAFFSVLFLFGTFYDGLSVIILFFLFDHIKNISLPKKYLQGCPNPQRINSSSVMDRLLAMSVTIISLAFCLFGTNELGKTVNLYFTVGFFFWSLFYYFLACDSIPPEEKAKRKARTEEWKGNLSPVQLFR